VRQEFVTGIKRDRGRHDLLRLIRMKLIEALRIANVAQEGPSFRVLLACGFTPLHLQTAVKAHLQLGLPSRSIVVRTGVYGDLGGTLENAREHLDAVLVALEWGDLDPRLSWRSPGRVSGEVISDARARLSRIEKAIAILAEKTIVALSLPALPLAPILHTPGSELQSVEAALWEMVYGLATSTRAVVLHPETLRQGSEHDLRSELTNGFPYSFPHADALAGGLVRIVLPPVPKKGLITDLDETLWSGILGDDGLEGISWDVEHKTGFHGVYQQLLNVLADAGILLGVASKNDAGLVDKALGRRDLVVESRHLFPIEAHWRPKPESVERILEAWNVAPDSVVFVDDNPLELAQVKAAFSTMECLEFRKDDARFLLELRDHFRKREIRREDKLRVASLRDGQAVRQAADSASLDALLAGAQARVTFRWGKQPPDPRALELINKTNQFNLNGVRYTQADWNAYLSDPATRLVVVEYEDRFGKLGKIAALAGREQDGGFEVEVWVMSCRAFSRRIEHQCLKLLLSRWESVRFRCERTERNDPMQDFLAEMAPGCQAIRRAAFSHRCPPLFHQTECTSA
jgi:FkbH-like protein